MAWRDLKAGRLRVFFCVAVTAIGISALVALQSFGESLRGSVKNESRVLLGADLRIKARRDTGAEAEAAIEACCSNQPQAVIARRLSFVSMALFPDLGTRLVRVRAIEGGYPFYGDLVTEPGEAAATYQQDNTALVDDGLMRQFGAQVGGLVRIGRNDYRISGRLLRIPGESMTQALVGPRVYIQRDSVDPELLSKGSRVDHDVFVRLADDADIDAAARKMRRELKPFDLDVDTPRDMEESWGRTLGNLNSFLGLLGFVALLLGGIGVASSSHVYAQSRITSIATLRCLGATSRQTLLLFSIEAGAIAVLGAAVGVSLGIVVHTFLPSVVRSFLPVEIARGPAWNAVLRATLVGTMLSLLFALLPLLSLRRVSPAAALRSGLSEKGRRLDPWVLVVLFLLLVLVALVAFRETGDLRWATWFVAALGGGVAVLFLGARALTRGLRRAVRPSWPYTTRQGVSNLFRPENQTTTLLLCMGLASFLVLCVQFCQRSLLDQVELKTRGDQPNLALFDVQDAQLVDVHALLGAHGIDALEDVPVVNMRLLRVNGRTIEEIRADRRSSIPSWVLFREYRSTFRDSLAESESIVNGRFVSRVAEGSSPVPISLEKRIARRLGVGVGEAVTFNVQGLPVECSIAGIREVNWMEPRPNFYAVFPLGVLEEAPKFHVILLRVADETRAATLQRDLIDRFPNISAIDLSGVLRTAEELLSRMAFVLRFMAAFSVVTGIVVLSSTLAMSRAQRTLESALLRTLGAPRRVVLWICAVEYLALGAVATTIGVLLALLSSAGLSIYLFDVPWVPSAAPVALAFVFVAAVTLLVGFQHTRGICDEPPLKVLRSEAAS